MPLRQVPPGQSPPVVELLSHQKRIVLVVDDEAQLRKLVGLILERDGYQVLMASNGPDALAICRGYPGPIHLLLSDIEMLGMSGVELGRQMIAERPRTRVLLISANSVYAELTQFPFLAKPFSLKELRIAVSRTLESPSGAAAHAELELIEPLVTGRRLDAGGARSSRRWWPSRAVPVWVAAAAMVLALVPLSLYQVSRRPAERPDTVNLRAMRGLADEAGADAGKPLALNLDVSGLPQHDTYRIELVSAVGHVIWGKAVPGQGLEVRTKSAALQPGVYFVRVYSPPGELLTEYALRVGKKK
jgi:CheY-like chemotaxis protein